MKWQRVNLGDLYKIGSSKRVLKSQWAAEGVPFYRGREITVLSKFGSVENDLFISKELYSEYADKYGVPKADDIVITAIGTIGNSYVVREHDHFYFKDASVLWLKRVSDVNSSFINLWLKSPLMKEQLDEGKGATVDTLTIKKLQSLQVDLPPIPEQQRIVAIIDQAFADIEKARANAEQNLKNARELFDSYLQQVFSQRGEGWVEHQMTSICEITSKLVDPRGEVYLDYPHIGAGNIVSNTGELVRIKTAREESLISGKFVFDSSMVLYSKIRPYLMKVCRPEFIGLCSADIYPLRPIESILNKDYLFYLLLSKDFTDYAVSGSGRAGMPKVNRTHLFNYSVWLPSSEVQQLYARRIDLIAGNYQALANVYERKLLSLDELKQSLLQKAFSGELTKSKGIAA